MPLAQIIPCSDNSLGAPTKHSFADKCVPKYNLGTMRNLRLMEKIYSSRFVFLAAILCVVVARNSANKISREAVANFEWLNSLGFPDQRGCPEVGFISGEFTSPERLVGTVRFKSAEIFVWAWACWRNGSNVRAAYLYNEAVAIGQREEPMADFREQLERDFGHAMILRATLDFEDPKISRAQLLVSFDRIVNCCPSSRFAGRAREMTDRLRAMVVEDNSQATRLTLSPASQSPRQRIAELIYCLRDQGGRQLTQPGYCDIFDFELRKGVGKNASPASQLAALGHAAVPLLIAALDDRRLSRAVGFQRGYVYSHHVLTVGDCAEQILERVAGRRFFEPKTSSSYPSKDGDIAKIKEQAEAWWREVEEKEENQALIDEVSQGKASAMRKMEQWSHNNFSDDRNTN